VTTKQLAIQVVAQDRASSVLRQVGQGASNMGRAVFAGLRGVGTFATAAVGALTSLRGLLLGGAAAVAVSRFVAGFGNAASEVEAVGDAAERLNLPVKMLSELRYAAKLAGVEFEGLAEGVSTATKQTAQLAITGESKAKAAFTRLGLSVRDANGQLRGMSELLPEILDALSRAEPAEKVYLAQKIFGPNGDKFLLFLQKGTRSLREYADEAKRLGVVFDPATVRSAQEYRDAVDRLSEAWLGFRVAFISAVGPAMSQFLTLAAQTVATVGRKLSNIAIVVREAFGGDHMASAKDALLSAVVFILQAVEDQVTTRVGAIMARVVAYVRLELGALASSIRESWDSGAMLSPAVALMSVVKRLSEDNANGVDSVGTGIADRWREAGEQVRGVTDAMQAQREASVRGAASGIAMLVSLGERWRSVREEVERAAKATQDAGLAVQAITWEALVTGWKDALRELVASANDVAGTAKRVVLEVSGSISSGLSGAIIDVLGGVKNLKDAFRDFLAATLRQVAQLILQFLILRAIASVFLAAAPGASVAQAPPTALGAPLEAVNPGLVLPNRGGVVDGPGRLAHFGRGGYVHGPAVNADVVPAMLTPGEGVVNRLGMAALGRGGLAALNSGQGAGVNVSVQQTVVVQGGGEASPDTLRKLQRATTEGVLAAMEKSPAARARMRALIGGKG